MKALYMARDNGNFCQALQLCAWTVSFSFLSLSCKVKSTYHNISPRYKYKQIIDMDNNL